MTPAIAITGAGVLSVLGDSPELVCDALRAGRRAIAPSGEADAAGVRIADFDASRYATVRGMRVYNRMTQLGICAAKRALDQAKLDPAGPVGDHVGVVMASTLGHLDTLLEYDRSLLTNGIARTNPALMPLAIASAPGAAAALAFNAKAFSITLSDGATSSLDAIGLAARLLAQGRARAAIVIGSFTPCRELSLSAERAGALSKPERFRVFDRRREGTLFGEAAVAFVLERYDAAEERGAPALGFVRQQRSTFVNERAHLDQALRRACDGALRASGLDAGQLGVVSAGANGSKDGDFEEAQALLQVLDEAAYRTPVIAVKASFGEALDAGGMLQVLVALDAVRGAMAPAIAAFEEPEVPGLHYLTQPTRAISPHALVSAMSQTGSASALVLSASL